MNNFFSLGYHPIIDADLVGVIEFDDKYNRIIFHPKKKTPININRMIWRFRTSAGLRDGYKQIKKQLDQFNDAVKKIGDDE